uniref:Uncharacterized protein n=1 Tax=Salix viminalis TaxID=40686 RepID=A0A6N2N852_SALVM
MKVVVLPSSSEGSRFCGLAACNQVSSSSGLSLSASPLCLWGEKLCVYLFMHDVTVHGGQLLCLPRLRRPENISR